ncbi:MAG: TIGR03016 family PEP-CTERM system-associated outer membrane protein [Burkholderiaceae bacterium]
MAITTSGRPHLPGPPGPPGLAPIAVAVALLLAPLQPSRAAEWRVAPTVKVEEIYTDNVALAPGGQEKSDFITGITPGVSVVGKGRNLQFQADYAYQRLHYAREDRSDAGFQNLNALATLGVDDRSLAVDAAAGISQQTASILGPQVNENYSLTNNRTTVRTASISPYFQRALPGSVAIAARYRHSLAYTDSATLRTSRSDDLSLSLNSDRSFSRKLEWGLGYTKERSVLDRAAPTNSSTETLNLRYFLTPQFYATGSGGYDRYDYAPLPGVSSPHGAFYTAGFGWRPSERSSLAASAGRKFYGSTYSLDAATRTRHADWKLSYQESVTTTLSQFAIAKSESTADILNQLFLSSIPDDTLRAEAVARFIRDAGLPPTLSQSINYLTNQIFLQKALRGTVALTGARNTVVLSVFDVIRKPQSSETPFASPTGIDTGLLGNTRQAGLGANWTTRVTPLTSTTLSATYTRSVTEDIDSTQRLIGLKALLASRLAPKTDGYLEFRHNTQLSDLSLARYRENAVSVFLLHRF